MSDLKISQLTTNPGIDGTETMPTAKSGSNFKNTLTALKTWILSGISGYLKTDGTTTGATSQAQELTNGVEATSGNDKSWLKNAEVRAGDNTAGTESYLKKTGVVQAINNTDSTHTYMNPDGSIDTTTKNGVVALNVITKTIKATLSSAQLQALDGAAIEIVADPGSGKAIKVIDSFIRHNFLTTAYDQQTLYLFTDSVADITRDYQLLYNALVVNSAQTSTGIGYFEPASVDGVDVIIEHKSLKIGAAASLGSSGDGTLDVYLTYQIISL